MDITLSVVIVEYKSIQEIQACVASLKKHIGVPYEVIISSNSCYGEEQRKNIGKDADEHVRWLFNARNGGFAYAMNEGLKSARGQYLAIMNPDCTLCSDIGPMVRFMDMHPKVGAIAPQMKDGGGNIQDTARPYVTLSRYIVRQIKRIVYHKVSVLSDTMDYTAVQTVDWLIGAFIMVSRKAYELTGGLDEGYFMYAEDLDWCTRIRRAGLEVVYFPEVTILYAGTRRARTSSKYARIFIKSHIRYWNRFGYFFGHPQRKHIVF